jgi:hypothetical protein
MHLLSIIALALPEQLKIGGADTFHAPDPEATLWVATFMADSTAHFPSVLTYQAYASSF